MTRLDRFLNDPFKMVLSATAAATLFATGIYYLSYKINYEAATNALEQHERNFQEHIKVHINSHQINSQRGAK